MTESVPRELTQERLNRGYARILGYRRDQALSVADLLEERATDAAERPFIIFEGQTITFAQMNRRANQVAHAALAAGLVPGDVVALMMDNRPEFPLIWLGLAKVGIVTALLNTSARERVLRHALGQTGASALIFGSECADRIATLAASELPPRVFELAHADDAPQRAPAAGARSSAQRWRQPPRTIRRARGGRRCAWAIRSITSSPPGPPACPRRRS